MHHTYTSQLIWSGSTATYAGYDRTYLLRVPGKPDLSGSADPAFRGDAELHNPEELLLMALSACHLLTFLALCARAQVTVLEYRDAAVGVMETDANGGGRFSSVTLRPTVTVAMAQDIEGVTRLHARARQQCFIANSVAFPVAHEPTTLAWSGA
jgi:organic hydroperoxide reductase OsmC/OhrA